MTQDEIIEMYMQVSKELCNDTEWCWAGVGEPLQMFAKLVAAKAFQDGYEKGVAAFNEAVSLEREACAKACEEEQEYWGWGTAFDAAALIRARGDQA